MNGETWVKAVASGIRKMKVINVACVLSNLLLYIYIYNYPSLYLQIVFR